MGYQDVGRVNVESHIDLESITYESEIIELSLRIFFLIQQLVLFIWNMNQKIFFRISRAFACCER